MIETLEKALQTVRENHNWHLDYDDLGIYANSLLAETNIATIGELEAAIKKAEDDALAADVAEVAAAPMKLFVWEGVLTDYTSGMMVAVAHDADQAREALLAKADWLPKSDVNQEPEVIDLETTEPVAFYVFGGA